MQIILFDDERYAAFLPLVYTRSVGALLLGIDTLADKWAAFAGRDVILYPRADLTGLFSLPIFEKEAFWINARFLPQESLLEKITAGLEPESFFTTAQNEIIACRTRVPLRFDENNRPILPENLRPIHLSERPPALDSLQDLFSLNGEWIKRDFARITAGRASAPITDKYTRVYGEEQIFLEPGVKLKACILDAETGPIYLANNVEAQHSSVIIGAHAIGPHTVIAPGAVLRGDSSFGPCCKIGGEVANSLMQGYSNKAHDGYLGNSLIGAWCNLGAGTNVSNLKNNYGSIKVFNYEKRDFVDTKRLFCGLTMGDYSRSAIGTLFNTGTVVGVAANVFANGFPPKFIPSFAWGNGRETNVAFAPEKVAEMLRRVMARRYLTFSVEEEKFLYNLFNRTEWERRENGFS